MRTTPLATRTICSGITLATLSVICIPFGWHLAGNILGAGAAINLLGGVFLKKY